MARDRQNRQREGGGRADENHGRETKAAAPREVYNGGRAARASERDSFYRNYMMGREAIIGMMDGPGAPLQRSYNQRLSLSLSLLAYFFTFSIYRAVRFLASASCTVKESTVCKINSPRERLQRAENKARVARVMDMLRVYSNSNNACCRFFISRATVNIDVW